MFRVLLCPSSGARGEAGVVSALQPGHYSSLTAPNLQHTTNQERNDQCGKEHHSSELLMIGIVMPETCWAYKKYNKIISGIELVFYSSVITKMLGSINVRLTNSGLLRTRQRKFGLRVFRRISSLAMKQRLKGTVVFAVSYWFTNSLDASHLVV
jgi:hypothetical protein